MSAAFKMNGAPATAQLVIALARAHVHRAAMLSSAELCLSDALEALGRGEYELAARRAFRSLGYSIGILHPDHATAAALITATF